MLVLLPGTSLLMLFPPGTLRRSLRCPFLIVLTHYGLPRLVAVIPVVKRLLLLHSRISIT